MSNSPKASYFLLVNLAMICISTSGALGRFISLAPPVTILLRSIIGFLFLTLILRIQQKSIWNKSIFTGGNILASVLMAGHWISYFFALQLSNVAIAMLSLFTYPLITAFIEPLMLKTEFKKIHLVYGVLTLVGIYFLIPKKGDGNSMLIGAIAGIISAFFYAFRNVLMKRSVSTFGGIELMAFQTFIIAILLLPVLAIYPIEGVMENWWPILILGIVTTGIGHSLFVRSFKYVSVSKISIISSLQPIFGIVIALIFLGEVPGGRTIIGGIIILSIVLLETLRKE